MLLCLPCPLVAKPSGSIMCGLTALDTSRFSYLVDTPSLLLHRWGSVDTIPSTLEGASHLSLHSTPSFLLQTIPSKPASFPSHTKNHPELKTVEGDTQMVRKQIFFFIRPKRKKNPQERPQRLLQISCQKNICLTLELHAWEIKGNLFLLCNQTLEKCLLHFPNSFENYLDTLCPALSYPLYQMRYLCFKWRPLFAHHRWKSIAVHAFLM